MKTLFIIVSLFSFAVGYSQTYEVAMERCGTNFRKGLGALSHDQLDTVIENRYRELRKCIIGQKLPSFQSTSFKNNLYSLTDLENKVVLINFWYIACPPCVAEVPMLNELQNEYKGKDFKLLSFSTDNRIAIKDFMSERKISFEIFPLSSDLIHNTFKMDFGYPTTIFLNKKGEIVEFKNGGPIEEVGLKRTKDEFKRIIDRELTK